ncbi:MAG: hypothetical protein CMJ87_13280 [Planctomycetes bacterium]|jgi:hypothetical protein|nr:hypothetical protein [Planctomycetota bacterium]
MLRYMGYVCAGLAGISLSVNVVLGILVYMRMQMPYDDTGTYFDAETLLVYKEQTILVLAVVMGLVALFMAGAFWFGRKLLRIWQTENA